MKKGRREVVLEDVRGRRNGRKWSIRKRMLRSREVKWRVLRVDILRVARDLRDFCAIGVI